MQLWYDILDNKFAVKELMQWLCKVGDSKVVLEMKQTCTMGVSLSMAQMQTIKENVLHGKTLYPKVNYDSDDDESVTGLPEQMFFETDSQLVIHIKHKEEFYELADKIIMKKMDHFLIRHFTRNQDKCYMLNIKMLL